MILRLYNCDLAREWNHEETGKSGGSLGIKILMCILDMLSWRSSWMSRLGGTAHNWEILNKCPGERKR